MKVKDIRSILVQVAELQRNSGDSETGYALDRLVTILESREKEEVSKVVLAVLARRESSERT